MLRNFTTSTTCMMLLDCLLLGAWKSSLRASMITSPSRMLSICFTTSNGNNLILDMNFEEEEKMVVPSTTQTSFYIIIFFSKNRTKHLVIPSFNVSNDNVYKKEGIYKVIKLRNKPRKQTSMRNLEKSGAPLASSLNLRAK